jgi:hypothetical protein
MATKKASTTALTNPLAMPLGRKELNELVEVALASPMDGYPGHDDCLWGLPLIIEGLPGNAKTARIKQMSKVLHISARSLFAAQHPPEDFSGALIPDGKGGARQICPLSQVRELIKVGRGIIFLDEVNGATPATQGAIQSFIHERVAGDQPIPGGIRMLAASNPEDIATGGFRFSPPLANRFMHVTDPGPTAREWSAFQMGNTLEGLQATLAEIEEVVISDWPSIFPETLGLFTAFMEANPSLLHKMPAPSDPQSSKSWPSPRTWDYAMRAWTTASILHKGDSIREALVYSCVGEGAGSMFMTYAAETDIPKPMDVLTGKWKVNPHRLDIVLAAYNSATAYVRQKPSRDAQLEVAPLLWKSLGQLFDAQLSDVVVPCVEGLIQAQLGVHSGNSDVVAAARPVLVRLSKSGVQNFLKELA